MAIKNRQEAEAILQNGGAPAAAKQEAQEYLDSLVIETPDMTGLDDDAKEQVMLNQNKIAAQETESPSGKTVVDTKTDIQKENEMTGNAKFAAVLQNMDAGKRASIEDAIVNAPDEIQLNIDAGNWTQEEVDAVKSTLESDPIKVEEIKEKNIEGTQAADEVVEELQNENKSVGESGSAKKDAEEIVDSAVPEGDKNNRHYKAVKSIWSAYYDGDFGPPGSKEAKEVAWYYTIDSLAKLANNIGKSLRNVGAAYTGGAIDTSEDEKSEWAKNRETLRNEATSMTQEDMGGKAGRQAELETIRNDLQKQARARGVPLQNLIEHLNQAAANAPNEQMKLAYMGLAAATGNGEVSDAQMIAMQATGLLEEFQQNPEAFMEKYIGGAGEAFGAGLRGAGKGLFGRKNK